MNIGRSLSAMHERNLERNRFMEIYFSLFSWMNEVKQKMYLLALLRCLILGCYDEANFEMHLLSRYIARPAIVPLMRCIFRSACGPNAVSLM